MALLVSFLRGINVGGHNMISMSELKALYENMGFKNISTYIQSGNVIFESDTIDGLSEKISKKIKETFQLNIPVILRNQKELQNILERNPFKGIDTKKSHVLLLSENLTAQQSESLNTFTFEPDRFFISGKEIFLHYPNGVARTKLTSVFFEKKTGLVATARNLNTIEELTMLLQHTA
jgi:uncharacterized protein (DUF1697 family)